MKLTTKQTVALASFAAGLLASSFAVAAVSNVKNTKHNFAIGGGSQVYQSTQITEVCVFCHTPHNGGSARLLWNKAKNSSPNFRLYTSSSTLTNATRQSTLSADSPSLLCLSCHDGKTAMNVLHNSPVPGPAAGGGFPAGSQMVQTATAYNPVVMPAVGMWDFFSGTNLPSNSIGMAANNVPADTSSGTNLTDDHPIGFSYSAAYNERSAGLNSTTTVATKSSNAIKFFGKFQKVECSTCHDAHVDYSAAGDPNLKPFLVMGNAQSALCLACHNK